MKKNNKMSRRVFNHLLTMGTAGFTLTGSQALMAACVTNPVIEANYPPVNQEQDDVMPVSFSDVLLLPAGEPDLVSTYGPSPQQFGELWLPKIEGPLPLVVMMHGGCWQGAYDIEHIRPASTALREAGYMVWSIEYRRIGDPGGGWPGTFEDIGLAVDHLGVVLDEKGLEAGSRIYMGHSAGGQLALWAGARPGFGSEHPFHAPQAKIPDAVFGLAAITDMTSYAAGESSCEKSTIELLGTPAAHTDRYSAVSPLELLPLGVPTVLAQGTEDPIVPPQQAETFHEQAVAAGENSSLLRLPGAGHFDLIHPRTDAWRAILSTLEKCS